ncbi:GTPase [bacterium endosymbiont of Pedicinus badii]|uniref:GTPase n=1 Tax=bacterium endosymbiont of Pedicinus badii TaxID=1719126 RepID=UPI00117C29E5|nr:GTPase [bacterium endosymbiont of Pedicinus badii]
MKKFYIAIIGEKNVGKSSLFNKLTRTKDAIITKQSGFTKDIKCRNIFYKNINIIFMDTKNNIILENTNIFNKKVLQSNLIIHIIDCSKGIREKEKRSINFLRKNKKKFLLVANKSDNNDIRNESFNFYSLGIKKIFYVSTIKNIGIKKLYKKIILIIKEETFISKKKYTIDQKTDLKISVIGRPNVGKSTLFNKILGFKRTETDKYPGTTKDSINEFFVKDQKKYEIIDTAGIKKKKIF